MKDAVKIVFLLIAGGCFGTISWFTFIDPKLTIDQYVDLVYAGMILLAFLVFIYLVYRANKRKSD